MTTTTTTARTTTTTTTTLSTFCLHIGFSSHLKLFICVLYVCDNDITAHLKWWFYVHCIFVGSFRIFVLIRSHTLSFSQNVECYWLVYELSIQMNKINRTILRHIYFSCNKRPFFDEWHRQPAKTEEKQKMRMR